LWNDRLRIAERVRKDWTLLSAKDRKTAAAALEKIDEDPIVGAPLFHPLRGYWSYHHGDLRVVYRIVSEARMILILKIARATEPEA
jgi:mRNA-degrading endonuclease RelE of RelBE toxin-antitoxin system